MSRINRQKHVMNELMEGDFDPPAENQQFARILKSRGNNLHEVEPAVFVAEIKDNSDEEESSASTFLVSMPTKFRKNIWVKRGNFVVIEMIAEGQKVKGEIVRILLPEHVKEFKKDGIWPAKFTESNKKSSPPPSEEDNESSSGSDQEPIERNPNRWYAQSSDEEESGSDTSDDEEKKIEGAKTPEKTDKAM